jgi:hypothetical protein
MWAITACAPGLYKRATEAVLQNHVSVQDTEIVNELSALLERYVKWRENWEEGLLRDDFPNVDDATLAKAGPTIYPQYLAFWALTNRFLLAVQPHRAPEAENNAINAALRIVEFAELRETE